MSTSSLRFGIAHEIAGDAEPVGVIAEARGAAAAVQRREESRVRQRERVGRPVLRLDVADRAELGRTGQRPEVVGDDAGQVGVHDQHRALAEILERGRDRRALAAARLGDRLRAQLRRERAALRIVRDDERAPDHRRRREDVAEHREREPAPRVLRRVEPLLPAPAAEGDHDLRHLARL